MRTQMNLVRFFCCLLVVAIIGMTIIHAEPEPAARLSRWEEDIGSDMQLKRYADVVRNYYNMFGKSRHGKRNDAAPMMELNATWETLKMIQDAQKQNKLRRQNIRQNKEQILLRDFPSTDADEYASYEATRSDFLPDIIDKYYNNV